ncbi:hypothetical protein SPAB_05345 [Salmonella enterica subsp. enterica serovar Paratyphi B str. SPB7]|uniref:Uncharacterized protein n=1 Tax=Salmonella paratyphi B (strain ATCC BAA-1250 / SPB7) TaxID=1016998 RepID=A0A6C6Z962_SALPB|nr:hypothetical protein SPAB_05345 [Salmonella enterica subsp. enterica serovar Paratyphi B str. SPB7]
MVKICTCCAPQQARFLTSSNTFPQDLNHNTSKPDSFLYLLRPATRSFFNHYCAQ